MTSSAAAFEVPMRAKSMNSVAQKSKPLPNDQKIVLNRIKRLMSMRLDFSVKLKHESNTIILLVSIIYSMRDLLSDFSNHA